MKRLAVPVITDQAHPKYRIGELLRKQYGELKFKEGVNDLSAHCRLRNKRTVSDWLSIVAGSSETINHHVLDKVLSFFELQSEVQLFSAVHKQLLKENSTAHA